jgi:hypothetical protein
MVLAHYFLVEKAPKCSACLDEMKWKYCIHIQYYIFQYIYIYIYIYITYLE